jgi:branched-chain amino acid transport system permease protein
MTASTDTPRTTRGTGSMSKLGWIVLAAVALAPLTGLGNYPLHLMIVALIWSYIYTSWAIMGRLGLVSFGHCAFLGVGAYSVVLAWNTLGWSPWFGGIVGIVATLAIAFLIGWPCFRFKIVGHYFAVVTLACAEIVRLIIMALREQTGGSLGITPKPALADGATMSLSAMQFSSKVVWFYIALGVWLAGLVVWRWVDRSMARLALLAISEEEEAAASIGINISRVKMAIMLLSAGMTAFGGMLYAQYQSYINPETVSSLTVSLQIVFGVIAGGMFVMLGPTVGAIFLLALSETLRVAIGSQLRGIDQLIYGAMLILFIIYMPKGILGELLDRFQVKPSSAPSTAPLKTMKEPDSHGT